MPDTQETTRKALPESTPGYPVMAAAVGRIEPTPRRVRGMLAGQIVFDTTSALYVWEAAYYPQYYVPLTDVVEQFLVDSEREQKLRFGTARIHHLRIDEVERARAARIFVGPATPERDGVPSLEGYVSVEWSALDRWFEEDEQIFVHPRNPYTRVDALRSHRSVRVELDGVVLAESDSPVLVFETGLPTRYYLDRTAVRFEHLSRTDTESECPYKGVTSDYWSVSTPSGVHADLAWSYRSTTEALGAIAGLVAFYDEKVDVFIDDQLQARPVTHL